MKKNDHSGESRNPGRYLRQANLMPISREEFEKLPPSDSAFWVKTIPDFLNLHKNEAFTGEELFVNIVGWPVLDMDKFKGVLAKLTSNNKIDKKTIHGIEYYTSKR